MEIGNWGWIQVSKYCQPSWAWAKIIQTCTKQYDEQQYLRIGCSLWTKREFKTPSFLSKTICEFSNRSFVGIVGLARLKLSPCHSGLVWFPRRFTFSMFLMIERSWMNEDEYEYQLNNTVRSVRWVRPALAETRTVQFFGLKQPSVKVLPGERMRDERNRFLTCRFSESFLPSTLTESHVRR